MILLWLFGKWKERDRGCVLVHSALQVVLLSSETDIRQISSRCKVPRAALVSSVKPRSPDMRCAASQLLCYLAVLVFALRRLKTGSQSLIFFIRQLLS